jgi:hypothetical protein
MPVKRLGGIEMLYEKCVKCGQLECSGAFTDDGFICAECELDDN